MLQLLAQHDAADKDEPRDREREEAGDQPAAEGEKLCLARVVELVVLCGGETRRRQGYAATRGAKADGAGIGDGLRIGSLDGVPAACVLMRPPASGRI